MIAKRSWRGLAAASLALVVALATPWAASADEADARKLLKAMSVYLAAQKTMAFSYDADLEVVTKDGQRLTLASSGTLALARPDKLRATRAAGFADIELVFDGKTATLLAKTGNVYARVDEPGSVDRLIDVLRDKYGMLLPAADLLLPDPYALLMADVVDVKDLGSGVVGGVECDHLAFRAKEVDWQIWIAHGPRPYPCKYVITSKQVAGGPQYSVQVRDWKAGSDVPASDFGFKPPAGSREVAFKDLPGASDLPAHFSK
ncbi:MAG: DUF2092 domain-containing protein [Rhodospirillales bacterium]|nr:MAG: DUF2092 domain-containing protein [Rhodospirillales bacterium]